MTSDRDSTAQCTTSTFGAGAPLTLPTVPTSTMFVTSPRSAALNATVTHLHQVRVVSKTTTGFHLVVGKSGAGSAGEVVLVHRETSNGKKLLGPALRTITLTGNLRIDGLHPHTTYRVQVTGRSWSGKLGRPTTLTVRTP
jgi:hypothetical protein